MPIFEYSCEDCGQTFESIEVWESHKAKECKFCKSTKITKIIGTPHVRMNPDVVLHSLPDPSPPLEELRDKTQPGCEGGYKDKPEAETNLGKYDRKKDKYGNTIWIERHPVYFTGQKDRRSSAEKEK